MPLRRDPSSVERLGLKRELFGFHDDTTTTAIMQKTTTNSNSIPNEYFLTSVDSSLHQKRAPTWISDLDPLPDFEPLLLQTTWKTPQLRALPKVYVVERSNRILDDSEHKLEDITGNLSECFRVLGIQAKYFETPAGVALLTPEQVEIFVYLWKTGGGKQVCVEVHRRRGDSVTFHRYASHILAAASGDFDPEAYKDYSDYHYLKAAEKLL